MQPQSFQSTLPHGERRPRRIARRWRLSDFNPRSRTGSDAKLVQHGCAVGIFQSTLPHGERLGISVPRHTYCIFQSTLPHGERRQKFHIFFRLWNFIYTIHTNKSILKFFQPLFSPYFLHSFGASPSGISC